MSLDVRPDHLKIVQDILSTHVPDREVWAFGSRVTGKATETSDLDLAIIGETPLEFETLAALRDAFSESRIPYKVDVVDWATTAESFRAIIQHEKMILQEGKKKSGGGEEWENLLVADSPLEIIDGDRGVNYPKQDDFKPTGYCLFLNAGNVTTVGFNFSECSFISKEKEKLLRKGKLQRNDIILTTRGTVGNVALFDESVPWDHVRINSGMVLLRAEKSKLLPRFLYQFVRSNIFKQRVAALTTGSAQPQLPIRDIRRVELPLPPLPEQRAIAHILGTLDDKIELNRRMNETLEAMAQAIFKSWFVDFDPVRAKMEGRETGLPKEIEDLFPDSFEDSELGEIPRGWGVASVGEVFELNPTERIQKGKVTPYLDMASVPIYGSYPDLPILRPFTSGSKFRNGDTLLARITPCLENGKTAFIQLLPEGEIAWGSTEFIVIRPREPFPSEFGYLLARDSAFRENAIQSMSGTSGRQRVQEDSLAAFKIVQPDSKILKFFGTQVHKWFQLIKLNSEQIFSLVQTRDTLLPKLLSGEIRIS